MSRPDPTCPLIGTWKLLGWRSLVDGDDPTTAPPDWERVQGQIIYTTDGTMSMLLSNVDRARFDDDAVYGGTPEEKERAFDDFRAYCGTFTYEGDRVVHHVKQSVLPNNVGSDQVRLVTLDGPTLVLTNVHRTRAVTWQRV
jgi:hypothetical protein